MLPGKHGDRNRKSAKRLWWIPGRGECEPSADPLRSSRDARTQLRQKCWAEGKLRQSVMKSWLIRAGATACTAMQKRNVNGGQNLK